MESKWNIFRNQKQINISKARPCTIICKKHHKHQQSPGVCSICLNEKLSKLSNTPRINTKIITSSCSSSSSSLSSLSSSSDVSSCSSPVHDDRMKTMDFLRSGKSNNVLTKSRSLICIPMREEVGMEENKKKKKRGFLSKLLRPRKNKMDKESLEHSRTTRERVST